MRLLIATIFLCLFAFPAQAGFQHEWDTPSYSSRKSVKVYRVKKQRAAKAHPFAMPIKAVETVVDGARRLAGVATSALPSPLQNALRQVAASCAGFRVISAHRPGYPSAGTVGGDNAKAGARRRDLAERVL